MWVCSSPLKLISIRLVQTTYMAKYPGRVVTNDKLAALVADAWPHSFTTLNVMSGFRKCGLFPFNPSAIDDRRLAP